MTDLSLVTFEAMWEELKKRADSGLYSCVVMAMIWPSDHRGEQRPGGPVDASQAFWTGGFHQAVGLMEEMRVRLLDQRWRDIQRQTPEAFGGPPDIDGGDQ